MAELVPYAGGGALVGPTVRLRQLVAQPAVARTLPWTLLATAPTIPVATPATVPSSFAPATPNPSETAMATTAAIPATTPFPSAPATLRPSPLTVTIAVEAGPAGPAAAGDGSNPLVIPALASDPARRLSARTTAEAGIAADPIDRAELSSPSAPATPEGLRATASLLLQGGPIAAPPAHSAASTALAPAVLPSAPGAVDHHALIDALVRARGEVSGPVALSVDHHQFGAVSLRFDSTDRGLKVAIGNAHPDFEQAVISGAAIAAAAPDQSAPRQSAHDAPPRHATGHSQAGGADGSGQQRPASGDPSLTNHSRQPTTRGEATGQAAQPSDADLPAPTRRARRGDILA